MSCKTISDNDSKIAGQFKYDNTIGLSDDMRNVIQIPQLCDVVFLVGEKREPLYGIKSILATRSRVFYNMIIRHQKSPSHAAKNGGRHLPAFLNKVLPARVTCIVSRPTANNEPVYDNHLKIPVIDFDVAVFSQILEFVHCGVVTINAHNVLGLLAAAQTFDFKDLKGACQDYAMGCLTSLDRAQLLITSSTKYLHFKTTKIFLQKAVNFMNHNGHAVRNINAHNDIEAIEYPHAMDDDAVSFTSRDSGIADCSYQSSPAGYADGVRHVAV